MGCEANGSHWLGVKGLFEAVSGLSGYWLVVLVGWLDNLGVFSLELEESQKTF